MSLSRVVAPSAEAPVCCSEISLHRHPVLLSQEGGLSNLHRQLGGRDGRRTPARAGFGRRRRARRLKRAAHYGAACHCRELGSRMRILVRLGRVARVIRVCLDASPEQAGAIDSGRTNLVGGCCRQFRRCEWSRVTNRLRRMIERSPTVTGSRSPHSGARGELAIKGSRHPVRVTLSMHEPTSGAWLALRCARQRDLQVHSGVGCEQSRPDMGSRSSRSGEY